MSELTHKFVAVMNKKIEPGKVMNALAHMTAGLVALHTDTKSMRFDTYTDKNGNEHPSISDHPFIILSAKNGNKIRTLRENLLERGIIFTDFVDTMTVGTYLEQKERTSNTAEMDLEYYGICTFAETKILEELTKQFSLWR